MAVDFIPVPPVEDPTLSANDSLGLNDTGNWTAAMHTEHPFIHSGYAYVISGVFVWSALFLTCFQVSRSVEKGKMIVQLLFAIFCVLM